MYIISSYNRKAHFNIMDLFESHYSSETEILIDHSTEEAGTNWSTMISCQPKTFSKKKKHYTKKRKQKCVHNVIYERFHAAKRYKNNNTRLKTMIYKSLRARTRSESARARARALSRQSGARMRTRAALSRQRTRL